MFFRSLVIQVMCVHSIQTSPTRESLQTENSSRDVLRHYLYQVLFVLRGYYCTSTIYRVILDNSTIDAFFNNSILFAQFALSLTFEFHNRMPYFPELANLPLLIFLHFHQFLQIFAFPDKFEGNLQPFPRLLQHLVVEHWIFFLFKVIYIISNELINVSILFSTRRDFLLSTPYILDFLKPIKIVETL